MADSKPPSIPLIRLIAGYALRLLIGLAAILAATGIVDYVIGWRGWFLYAESLFIVGGLCLALGALGAMGNWSQTRSFPYQYASSVSSADAATRARQDMKDVEASYSFSFLALLCGFALIGLSLLIHQLI